MGRGVRAFEGSRWYLDGWMFGFPATGERRERVEPVQVWDPAIEQGWIG